MSSTGSNTRQIHVIHLSLRDVKVCNLMSLYIYNY